MNKLYRLVWTNPDTDKKMATWWTPSKEYAEQDIPAVIEKFGVEPALEERKV